MSVWAVLAVAVVAVASGCDSDPETDGTGGSGGGGAGGTSAVTLDTVCAYMAERFCNGADNCCQAYSGYDINACIAQEAARCDANVALVEAGEATFSSERVEPCLAAHDAFHMQCEHLYPAVTAYARQVIACDEIFTGSRALGETCEHTAQCANPPGELVTAFCHENVCTAAGYLSAGSDCVIGSEVFTGCEPGLYCHIEDFMTMPLSGQCQVSPAIGEPCSGTVLECGLGVGLCNEDGVCEPAVSNGGSCGESHFVCESFNCGASGVCEPLMLPVPTQCGIAP